MHEIVEKLQSLPPLILGSGSSSRRAVLAEIGVHCEVVRPNIDERAADYLFHELQTADFAHELASQKATVVAEQYPDSLVLTADQVGVIPSTPPRLLTKQSTVEAAVAQLMSMSGTSHSLINALVLCHFRSGINVSDQQEIVVTMRRFTESEAYEYITAFQPFESAGSYRIEDQALMAPIKPFIETVIENDESGVRGLPLSTLANMLDEFEEHWQRFI